jgi:hypothetical protein
MEALPDCKLVQAGGMPPFKSQQTVNQKPERQWAGHCGCGGSCAFQFFNDDMELVDVRPTYKSPDEGSPPPLAAFAAHGSEKGIHLIP